MIVEVVWNLCAGAGPIFWRSSLETDMQATDIDHALASLIESNRIVLLGDSVDGPYEVKQPDAYMHAFFGLCV